MTRAGALTLGFGLLAACTLVYPIDRLGPGAPDADAAPPDAGGDGDVPPPPDAGDAPGASCNYDWTDFTAPQTGAAFDVALADVDKDGLLDLAMAHSEFFGDGGTGGAKVMLGQAGGTFKDWTEDTSFDVAGMDVATVDFDKDGRPDVIVALDNPASDTAGIVQVSLTTATGTLGDGPRIYPLHPTAIDVGDVDGDGNVDLVVISDHSNGFSDQRVVLYLGAGKGELRDPLEYDKTVIGHGDNQALAVGDLDQDGRADIVLSNWGTNALTILGWAPTGGLQRTHTLPNVCEVPWGVAIGDFDADHVPDLAVACGTANGFMVLIGQGGGFFKPGPVYPLVRDPAAIATADLDGDGHDDVLETGDGEIGFRLARPSGGASFGPPHIASRGSIAHQAGIAVGDIDKDGVRDAVVAGWSAAYPIVLHGRCK